MIAGLAITVSYLCVLLVRKPYRRKGDDRLHLLVQTELILIIYCGYAFQVPGRWWVAWIPAVIVTNKHS